MNKYNNGNKYIVSIIIIILAVIVSISWRWSSLGAGAGAGATDLTETYTDTTYNFSLKYPAGFITNSFANPSGDGDVDIISNPKTGEGLQIIISPYDASTTDLTVQVIKQNLPNLAIINPTDTMIGGKGNGVAFLDGLAVATSTASSTTSTNRQVWFVEGGNLYQITAPESFDQTLEEILNSWVFGQ